MSLKTKTEITKLVNSVKNLNNQTKKTRLRLKQLERNEQLFY